MSNEKYVKKCEFNIDTGCVEVVFDEGGMMSIDCTAAQDELADNRIERSELDYLIYNAHVSYVNLILSGKVESYLTRVIDNTLQIKVQLHFHLYRCDNSICSFSAYEKSYFSI